VRSSSTGPRAGIVGIGHYLPERCLDNRDFAAMGLDTSEEWILPRTGIRSRRIAAPQEATSDMAILAAAAALRSAALAPADIDLLLLATATPDSPVPPASALVLRGLPGCAAAAMDISAACAGFIFAAHTAAGLLESGMHRRALVVGAETLSRITDYTDRSSCVLFGDGAGAVVMQAEGTPRGAGPGGRLWLRLLHSAVGTRPEDAGLIRVEAGGSRRPASADTVAEAGHCLRLEGREVFRRAVAAMTGAAAAALDTLALSVRDLRWIIPHQANGRIVHAVGAALGADEDRVVDDIGEVGNTSAASLPIALDRLLARRPLETGDAVMLLTFGAGTNWGCQVYRAEA
jgi:3-oxoacyl-[acyl-carrier-protein] synthase-3